MRPNNFLLCLFLCGIFFLGCKENKESKQIETAPVEFTQEAEVYLVKSSGDTIKQLQIEISDNDYERETGLMYRKDMQENQGMLFIFDEEQPRGFYMKNTYIPLDIIFLDAAKEIVSFSKNAEPQSMETILSGKPAKYVLEINAGLADEWNLEVGDRLILNRGN